MEDREAWEGYAGITIGRGDAVCLRTGRWARSEAEGPWNVILGIGKPKMARAWSANSDKS